MVTLAPCRTAISGAGLLSMAEEKEKPSTLQPRLRAKLVAPCQAELCGTTSLPAISLPWRATSLAAATLHIRLEGPDWTIFHPLLGGTAWRYCPFRPVSMSKFTTLRHLHRPLSPTLPSKTQCYRLQEDSIMPQNLQHCATEIVRASLIQSSSALTSPS